MEKQTTYKEAEKKLDEALKALDHVELLYPSQCRDLWTRHHHLEELIIKAATETQEAGIWG